MRFVRRFRRLNWFVAALFWRRVRALVRLRYTYLALLLVVAVPASWHGLLGENRYLGSWILLTSALVLVGLWGRAPRRRNIRRRLGPWFFWLGAGSAVIGLTNTALWPVLQLAIPDKQDTSWLADTISVGDLGTVWIASIYITVLAAPFLLRYFSRLLAISSFRGRALGRKLSPGNLYRAILVVLAIGVILVLWVEAWRIDDPSDFLIAISIAFFVFILPIANCQKPWDRTTPILFSTLTQAVTIYAVSIFVYIVLNEALETRSIGFRLAKDVIVPIWIFLLIAGWVGSIGYWVLRRVKISLVEAAPGGGGAALSIYPDASIYVDIGGYAARLENLIRSSDAGVIGITGVRGSGKSALLGYVLSKFKRQHCLLWMTAPVSHERGMAFLMSVCRALCNVVLREAEPILYGRTTERGQAMSEFLRRGRVAVLFSLLVAAVALITWRSEILSTLLGDSGIGALTFPTSDAPLPFPDRIRSSIDDNDIYPTVSTSTSRSAFTQVLGAERKVIGALLSKILLALNPAQSGSAPPAKGSVSGYLLSPIALDLGFNLIFLQSRSDIQAVLADHLAWIPKSEYLREFTKNTIGSWGFSYNRCINFRNYPLDKPRLRHHISGTGSDDESSTNYRVERISGYRVS